MQGAGETPVHHLGLAKVPHQYVGGLEVPVDDALAVGVGDGLAGGQDPGQQAQAGLLVAGVAHGGVQAAAPDEAHGVPGASPVLPQVVDGDDAGVVQARGEAGLAAQARGVGGVVVVEGLAGDHAAQPSIGDGLDAAHAPLPHQRAGAVALVPGRGSRGTRRGAVPRQRRRAARVRPRVVAAQSSSRT